MAAESPLDRVRDALAIARADCVIFPVPVIADDLALLIRLADGCLHIRDKMTVDEPDPFGRMVDALNALTATAGKDAGERSG